VKHLGWYCKNFEVAETTTDAKDTFKIYLDCSPHKLLSEYEGIVFDSTCKSSSWFHLNLSWGTGIGAGLRNGGISERYIKSNIDNSTKNNSILRNIKRAHRNKIVDEKKDAAVLLNEILDTLSKNSSGDRKSFRDVGFQYTQPLDGFLRDSTPTKYGEPGNGMDTLRFLHYFATILPTTYLELMDSPWGSRLAFVPLLIRVYIIARTLLFLGISPVFKKENDFWDLCITCLQYLSQVPIKSCSCTKRRSTDEQIEQYFRECASGKEFNTDLV